MRWDALFADMELQLDAAAAAELTAQVQELTRAEQASVLLLDRLRAQPGATVRLVLRPGAVVQGEVREVGPAWLLLLDGVREHLVPAHAVVTVTGLGVSSGAAGPGLRRLRLGHALRGIARDRSLVRVSAGPATVHGRVDVVGADHVDVAVVHADSGRPTGERHTIALAALDVVTRL